MAKEAKAQESVATEDIQELANQMTPEGEVPKDVTQPTREQLMAELQSALSSGDFKAVAAVSRRIDTMTKAAEKAELTAKQAVLESVKEIVQTAYLEAITPFIDDGSLDAAEGVWISHDFGEQAPTVRLTRTATRTARTGGGGTGKKFDISTDDMLAKHGEEPYKDTGMTVRQAYDSNTDKNWRYAIRTKLLKLEGII